MKPNTRRSPREVIESVDQPELEEAWYKFPRQEMVACSINRERDSVRWKVHQKGRKYMHIHTHPGGSRLSIYPSSRDLDSFLLDKMRSMVIAKTSPKTGKLESYFVVRKKKFVPQSSSLLPRQYEELLMNRMYEGIDDSSFAESLDVLFRKYDLQWRYVPVAEGKNAFDSRAQYQTDLADKLKTEYRMAA